MKKRYNREVQILCKTSSFGLIKCNKLGDLDQVLLEFIVSQVKEVAPLMTSFVFSMGLITITFSTPLTSHLALIKLVVIFVIMCRLAH